MNHAVQTAACGARRVILSCEAYSAAVGRPCYIPHPTGSDSQRPLNAAGYVDNSDSGVFVNIIVAVDPYGEFVYVANRSTQNVTPYTINQTTGALTAGTTVAAELNPQAITVDPSGRYVYVANGDSNSVSGYTIDSGTGALSTNGSVATGLFPRSIVTTGVIQ